MNIDVDVLLVKISKHEADLAWVNEAMAHGDLELLHDLVLLRWRYKRLIKAEKKELEQLYACMPLPAELTTIFSGHTQTKNS